MPRVNRAPELVEYLDSEGRCARRAALVARFGRPAFERAVALGNVVEVVPAVFAATVRALEFSTRVRALNMWLPRGAAITGLAALSLYGMAERDPRGVMVVALSHQRVRGPEWVRVLRTGPTRRAVRRGIMCVSRERAVIDAWCEASESARVTTVLEAMRRSNITGSAVLRTLEAVPRVKRRRELVQILEQASMGIQSYLEHRAKRTVLNTADFRGLERQVDVFAMGQRYTVDTLHRATGTVVEFDGAKVHGSSEAKRRDNVRDAALLTLGLVTLRIGYDDVMTRPAWCREVIRRAIAVRAVGLQQSLTAS